MQSAISSNSKPRISLNIVLKLFVGFIALGGILWYVNTYIYHFLASTDPVTVAMTPTKEVLDLSGVESNEFDVAFQVTGQDVSGLELYLTYDSKYLQYGKEFANSGYVPSVENAGYQLIVEEVAAGDEGKKIATIVLVTTSENTSATPSKALLLTFKFRATAAATETNIQNVIQTITLDNKTQFVGTTDAGAAETFANPVDAVIASVTVSRTAGASPVPVATSCQNLLNEIQQRVNASCGDANYLKYADANKDKTINIQDASLVGSHSDDEQFCSNLLQNEVDPCDEAIPPSITPEVSISPEISPVVSPVLSPEVSPEATITVEPVQDSPAPTETIIGIKTVKLDLKLRFQGVLKQPQSPYDALSVKVILAGDNNYSAEKTATFKADGSGVWSGTVVFEGVDVGSKYSLGVKGGKHLTRKICDLAPNETIPGTYRCQKNESFVLKEGDNALDFSKIVLLAGDLPVQNGVVDAADISYIRQNFGSRTAEVLARGDLNFDGIIDTQDYVMVLAALGFKYDETL